MDGGGNHLVRDRATLFQLNTPDIAMCELLNIIFYSFWTFAGTLILIGAVSHALFKLVVVPFAVARGYNIKI